VQQFQSHGSTVLTGKSSGTICKGDRLGQAAQQGDLSKVKKLMKQGVDPDYRSRPGGPTAISMAAEFGHNQIIKVLLDAKASVDACNQMGCNALMLAVQFEVMDTVRLLCQHKADVNFRASSWPAPPADATPLDLAARHNRGAALQCLLEYGAKVDVPAKDNGWTALTSAARGHCLDACRLLLDAGADPTITGADGMSAIEFALLPGNEELAKLMPPDLLRTRDGAGSSSAAVDEDGALTSGEELATVLTMDG